MKSCKECGKETEKVFIYKDLRLCVVCYKKAIGYVDPPRETPAPSLNIHIDGKGPLTPKDKRIIKKFIKKVKDNGK